MFHVTNIEINEIISLFNIHFRCFSLYFWPVTVCQIYSIMVVDWLRLSLKLVHLCEWLYGEA